MQYRQGFAHIEAAEIKHAEKTVANPVEMESWRDGGKATLDRKSSFLYIFREKTGRATPAKHAAKKVETFLVDPTEAHHHPFS